MWVSFGAGWVLAEGWWFWRVRGGVGWVFLKGLGVDLGLGRLVVVIVVVLVVVVLLLGC